MMARTFRFLGMLVAFGLLLLPCTPSLAVAQISSASNVDTVRSNDASLTNAGFMFIENVGQFDRAALFQVRGAGGTWWIAGDAIWITVVEPVMLTTPADRLASPGRTLAIEKDDHPQPSRGVNLKLTFPGSNPHSHIEPFDRLDTHVSYFIGGDRAKWLSDVPVWGGLRYLDLYPGIDLELTGESGQMAPRLITRPGASVNRVNLRIEGADAVVVDGGVLRASTVVGEGALPLLLANRARQTATVQPRGTQVFEVAAPFADATARPAASATSAGAGRAVERGRSLAGGSPGRASGVSDLLYATFLGGSGAEQGAAIAADGSGSAYVAGYTGSIEFPTTPGAFDTGHNGGDIDAFVVKLNPTGSARVYATFLGGSNWDQANAIAVDGAGSAYVTGCTGSTDFPTTPGAFDTSFNGLEDAFVVKLNPAGSVLAYATFLGSNESPFSPADKGYAIAVDGTGTAYVTGETNSTDFPTTPGAFDTSLDDEDTFVVKLNPAGSDLAYATFLGGSTLNGDHALGIALGAAGSAYVTGWTASADFPTTPGAFDTSYNGGNFDTFVVRFAANRLYLPLVCR